MKKRISCKLFFAVMFSGIWNAFKWIVGMFGYKDGSSFGKVVKRIFALCATILMVLFTSCALYAFAKERIYKGFIRPYTNERVREERHISNHIVFQRMYYSDKTRVYDENLKKVLLEDVDWVVTSDDYDSLAVFSKNQKRGYLNRFTGEVAIPETYTRAWIFSEGLAAVEDNGKLIFIDHKGNVVIDNNLEVHYDDPKYTFEKGYCIIKSPVTGKMGLIDKRGEWVLPPEYDNIFNDDGFWQVKKDGCVGLYSAELRSLFPVNNSHFLISDSVIEVRHADHTAKRYDFNGNVLVDFVIDEISNMQYETDMLKNEVSEEECYEGNNKIYGIANRQYYRVSFNYYSSYYGLISRDGKRITPPIYTSIEAVNKNRYLCQPHGIIIDDNGEIIE